MKNPKFKGPKSTCEAPAKGLNARKTKFHEIIIMKGKKNRAGGGGRGGARGAGGKKRAHFFWPCTPPPPRLARRWAPRAGKFFFHFFPGWFCWGCGPAGRLTWALPLANGLDHN